MTSIWIPICLSACDCPQDFYKVADTLKWHVNQQWCHIWCTTWMITFTGESKLVGMWAQQGLSDKTHVTSWVFWLPMKNVRIVSHNHIHKDQNRFLSHEAKIARGQTEEDSLWAGEMDWQKGQVEVRTRITAGTTAIHIQDCKSSYVGRRGL